MKWLSRSKNDRGFRISLQGPSVRLAIFFGRSISFVLSCSTLVPSRLVKSSGTSSPKKVVWTQRNSSQRRTHFQFSIQHQRNDYYTNRRTIELTKILRYRCNELVKRNGTLTADPRNAFLFGRTRLFIVTEKSRMKERLLSLYHVA